MKGKLLIIFHTEHGRVKRYVDILGNALGCDAVPADKFRINMIAGYDKLLFIGPMRGTALLGYKKIAGYVDIMYKQLIVCGVGMLPYRKSLAERVRNGNISVAYEKFIPTFYVQGGFDATELTKTERMSLGMTVRQIKTASLVSDDDTFLLNAIEQPFDSVKKANIEALIDYLDDKTVDPELYSPPEITDEEEEKKFFEEQDKAEKAPLDKKRALKKKLKK